MGDGGGVVLGRSVCFPFSCPPSLSIPPSATQDISVKQLVETFANTIQIQMQIQVKPFCVYITQCKPKRQ